MIPIIGIDPSLTALGYAMDTRDGGVATGTIRSDAKQGGGADPARWRTIAGGLYRALDETGILAGGLDVRGLVIMEGVPLGSVTGNIIDLASLRAIIAYGLVARGYRLIDHKRKPPKVVKGKKVTPPDMTGRGISSSTLKLFALGKGAGPGTDKDAVIIAARDRMPHIPINNNNEADALWLWAMGHIHYYDQPNKQLKLPARNLTALDTIDWPQL